MRRTLIILCLIAILPAPLFAQDFTFKAIRFFEGGYNPPEESQRVYIAQFPKNTTRYVWCRIEVENRLYNVREHIHKVIWRYYNADGTLRGEMGADFRIKPEWETAWIPHGWGADQPGTWPVGTYRAEVWIDGKKIAQDSFKIYDDLAALEFEFVKFFEGPFIAPPESQRELKTQFPKSTTRYIFFSIGVKNLLYKNRGHKPVVVGRYYNPDGSFRGEGNVNVDIPPDWENADLWSGWGWEKPGNWPAGTYRVEILFGNVKVGEGSFSIYDDRPSTSPPITSVPAEKVYLEFQSVKFFEGGGNAPPPESQNQYKTDFPRSTTRYIYFFVNAKNLLYRNRNHKPLIFGRYYYPDGTLFGEMKIDNVEVSTGWQNAEFWTAWGWDEPGRWTLGTYRVEILFGNTKVGEGRFTIYDDRR